MTKDDIAVIDSGFEEGQKQLNVIAWKESFPIGKKVEFKEYPNVIFKINENHDSGVLTLKFNRIDSLNVIEKEAGFR